jgi:hypothetical protein
MGKDNVRREKKVEKREMTMMMGTRQGQRRPGGILKVALLIRAADIWTAMMETVTRTLTT